MKTAIPLIAAALVSAFFLGGQFFSKTVYIETEKPLRLLPQEEMASVIKVPAVDENGKGVLTEIGVTVKPGSGKTLTSIENILFFVDTQNSIRTARDVARDLTGFDLFQHDLIYTIKANASLIEGPSAGAAITIATIAALEGKELRPGVMITGTIRPDGSIGRVGQIQEKARVAKESGASLFLIPRGTRFADQGFEYKRTVTCRTEGGLEICETGYVKRRTSGPGIEMKEVGTVEEALKYFIGGGFE
jgi:uncharacterized protein